MSAAARYIVIDSTAVPAMVAYILDADTDAPVAWFNDRAAAARVCGLLNLCAKCAGADS